MAQNLDLEKWQKTQNKKQGDFHDHVKNTAKDEFTIRNEDGKIKVERKKNASSKNYYNLPPQYIEAMKNDEIIDILTSNIRHERSLFLFKLIFTAFCLFFIFMAFVIIIQEKQPAGFLFIIVPVFMLRQIFKARKKRYMVFGKKSFYYPPLLHRAIDYDEIISVDYIMAEIRTTQNNPQKTYMRKLLQFVFNHEISAAEYGGESSHLRVKAQYQSYIPADQQACIFPQPFEAILLNGKIYQYFQKSAQKQMNTQKEIMNLLLTKPS